MGKLVVKMKKKYYPEDEDMLHLVKYIAGKGKNEAGEQVAYVGAKGVSKDCEKAVKQMITVQKAYKKNNKRRMYHLIVSFPEEYDEWYATECAKRIAMLFQERFQMYYALHTATDNPHVHYGINAVSFKDGKKLHMSKKEFEAFKREVEAIYGQIF